MESPEQARDGDTTIKMIRKRLKNCRIDGKNNINCKFPIKELNRIRLIKKRNMIRPKTPHNTSSFLIQTHQDTIMHQKTEKEGYMNDDTGTNDKGMTLYSIEDFMITGGSMKGIFLI